MNIQTNFALPDLFLKQPLGHPYAMFSHPAIVANGIFPHGSTPFSWWWPMVYFHIESS
jgi:hypothetical protein